MNWRYSQMQQQDDQHLWKSLQSGVSGDWLGDGSDESDQFQPDLQSDLADYHTHRLVARAQISEDSFPHYVFISLPQCRVNA